MSGRYWRKRKRSFTSGFKSRLETERIREQLVSQFSKTDTILVVPIKVACFPAASPYEALRSSKVSSASGDEMDDGRRTGSRRRRTRSVSYSSGGDYNKAANQPAKQGGNSAVDDDGGERLFYDM
jgi:hypothetical protein